MALPSPTSARTGRSRSASFTPSAAGSPQPMPPPRMPKKLFASAQPKKWRTPCAEEIDSSTITAFTGARLARSEEHTSELQSRGHLVCRLLLEKKKKKNHEHQQSFKPTIITTSS